VKKVDWIKAAQTALVQSYGLPVLMAAAVAEKLYEREPVDAVRGPLTAVMDHMSNDEPPLVDPESAEWDAHTEEF